MRKFSFDVIGDIAILKFPIDISEKEKKKLAKKFLDENKSLKTILEKSDRVKGRLRIAKNKFLAGEDKRETIYAENGCRFKINVDETYFSVRLAEQRKKVAEEIARQIGIDKIPPNSEFTSVDKIPPSKNFALVNPMAIDGTSEIFSHPENSRSEFLTHPSRNKLVNKKLKNRFYRVPKILVMFAGIAPFPIVIAKKLKEAGKKAEIVSSEINRKASKYAEENVKLNKMENYIKVIQGDSKKLPEKLKEKFDFIIMPRPNLKETFLKSALKMAAKKAEIYYYGFGEKEKVLEEIRKFGIKKIRIEKAGEIAPYKFRWLAKFRVR